MTAALHMVGARPRGGDPYWDNVVLLMHFDGANGSTVFTDSSKYAHAMGSNGTPQIITDSSQFGGASLWLDGTGDYLTPDAAGPEMIVGTQDFTAEFFFNKNRTDTQIMFDTRPGSANTGFAMGLNTNNTLRIIANGGTAYQGIVVAAGWHHYALSRSGGVTHCFINGNEAFNIPDTFNYSGSNLRRPIIGASQSAANEYRGWIDELRFTIGVGRYVAPFTPPTEPFPDG